MKIVAIHEIHYVDEKTKTPTVAKPGALFDIPKDEADRLLVAQAVRRLTNDEIELDKLRAASLVAATKAETKTTAKTGETKTAAKTGESGKDPEGY